MQILLFDYIFFVTIQMLRFSNFCGVIDMTYDCGYYDNM